MKKHSAMAPSLDRYLKTPDGTLIRYRSWKTKTTSDIRPTILILPGRATALETFDNVVEALQGRGYNIWCFDWRGQGLSTREIGRRGYIDSYETYLSDLDLFIRTFLKTDHVNRPIVVLGQSMGGHLALRYMAENPGVISGAVLTAPMLDIETGIYSRRAASWLSNFMTWLGRGKSYVFQQEKYNPVTQPFEGNMLTYNKELFYYHRHLQIQNPDIIVGGVTYGWVKATLESVKILNDKSFLKRINVPIKIYAADEEFVVDNNRLEKVSQWLPKCELEVILGTRHQLLAEQPDVLNRIYNGIDRFVMQNFKLPLMNKMPSIKKKNVTSHVPAFEKEDTSLFQAVSLEN